MAVPTIVSKSTHDREFFCLVVLWYATQNSHKREATETTKLLIHLIFKFVFRVVAESNSLDVGTGNLEKTMHQKFEQTL